VFDDAAATTKAPVESYDLTIPAESSPSPAARPSYEAVAVGMNVEVI